MFEPLEIVKCIYDKEGLIKVPAQTVKRISTLLYPHLPAPAKRELVTFDYFYLSDAGYLLFVNQNELEAVAKKLTYFGVGRIFYSSAQITIGSDFLSPYMELQTIEKCDDGFWKEAIRKPASIFFERYEKTILLSLKGLFQKPFREFPDSSEASRVILNNDYLSDNSYDLNNVLKEDNPNEIDSRHWGPERNFKAKIQFLRQQGPELSTAIDRWIAEFELRNHNRPPEELESFEGSMPSDLMTALKELRLELDDLITLAETAKIKEDQLEGFARRAEKVASDFFYVLGKTGRELSVAGPVAFAAYKTVEFAGTLLNVSGATDAGLMIGSVAGGAAGFHNYVRRHKKGTNEADEKDVKP